MAADWRSSISGVLGSVTVHFASVFWMLAALFGGPIWEPGSGGNASMQIFEAQDSGPAFGLTPTLFEHDYVLQVKNTKCRSFVSERVPTLLGSARFPERRAMSRAPLVCVRVEPNGAVTSATVLLSSGNRAIDAAVESHARDLVFEAARPGEPLRAVTVTLEVIGARGPNTAQLVRFDSVQPSMPPM
ncbi:energy transducer TonB [Sphingomonas sp.]|uniref:energy transducer TonB family protein n=1 Tax=Sphingomonas sp. TaxID=28214 RepID=UPI0035BC66BD